MAVLNQVVENPNSMTRGKLIVLEGLDKSGKETQSQLLYDNLKIPNTHINHIGFPHYESATGRCIRRYLDGEQSFSQKTINLLYSANRYERKHLLDYWLERGDIIICDRYYFSNMAYGSSDKEGETMQEIEEMDSEMPKPDLVIYIDISAEESLKRSGKTADKNEKNLKFLHGVRANYFMLFNYDIKYDWIEVNGEEDKQEIHEQIVSLVEDRLFKNRQ